MVKPFDVNTKRSNSQVNFGGGMIMFTFVLNSAQYFREQSIFQVKVLILGQDPYHDNGQVCINFNGISLFHPQHFSLNDISLRSLLNCSA